MTAVVVLISRLKSRRM